MAQDEEPAARKGTVLVVEDEMLVQMLVSEVVADLGLEALEAHDGPSALQILDSGAPVDLLVTDVGLPGMNGRQLAEAARSLRPGLKVLFVTGYADARDVDAAFRGEGVDVVTKPFALDVLSRKVAAMLGKA